MSENSTKTLKETRQSGSLPVRRYGPLQLLGLAILLGVATGLLGISFNWLLAFLVTRLDQLISHWLRGSSTWQFILLPIVGSGLLGLFYRYVINEKINMGIAMEDIFKELCYLDRLILQPQQVIRKVMGIVITLISGLSVGIQGPMVYLGGVLGANFGYRYHFSNEQIKIIIGCSVAGALSSAFGVPLFAAVFVLEVLLKESRVMDSFPVFVSAIVATGLRQWIYRRSAFLKVLDYQLVLGWTDYGYLILLGVLSGLVAALYIRSIRGSVAYFNRSRLPYYLTPLLAGLATAIVGYFYPAIFRLYLNSDKFLFKGNISQLVLPFGGETPNGQALALLGLMFLIIFLTALTLGSGGLGGGFTPGIFIGLCLGTVYGLLLKQWHPAVEVTTYTFLGMIGVFAGFSWAPLSASALGLGLVAGPEWMLPVLTVVAISTAVTRQVVRENLYIGQRALIECQGDDYERIERSTKGYSVGDQVSETERRQKDE